MTTSPSIQRTNHRIISHELLTPVSHIVGYADILLEEANAQGSEQCVAALQRIFEAGHRLSELVDARMKAPGWAGTSADLASLDTELVQPLGQILSAGAELRELAADTAFPDFADLDKITSAAQHMCERIGNLANLAHPSHTAQAVDPLAALDTQPPATDGSGMILVVDNNPANRDILSRRLERLGYTVDWAEHGLHAIEKLQDQPFDLILLDMMMPELDGYAILSRLKSNPKLRHLPVIIISANHEVESVAACIELGAEDYLIKPFNPVLLGARITAALNKKRQYDSELSYLHQIEQEKKRADDLLHIVIPIGIALSSEKNLNSLLEKILLGARALCNADGGTLYLRTDDDQLQFVIARTDSLGIAMGGVSGDDIPFAPLRMYDEATGAPNAHYVVTHVALNGESINIPDIYAIEDFDVSGTRSFDRQTGYRTISLLTVPLKDNSNRVIGVLQLLNAQDRATGAVIPFDSGLQQMIESLSALAAIALEAYAREQRLYKQIEDLRIEIDEIKKQREVAAITGSKYFRQLQAQTRELRQSANETSASPALPHDSDHTTDVVQQSTGEPSASPTTAFPHSTADNGHSQAPRHKLAPERRVYTINDQPIVVREQGPSRGQVVLLIHGWSSSWYALSPLLPTLSERYRCLAVDLPGYGESPPGRGRATIAGYADVLAGLIRQLSDRPALLIGHSMGGMISLTLALNHPDLVERMVLLCPTISGRLSLFIQMFISPVTMLERFKLADRLVSAFESQFLGITDRLMRPASFAERTGITEHDYHHLRQDARRRGQGLVRAECYSAMQKGDLRGKLSRIKAPSLVLWGMEDNTVPLRDASAVVDEWPEAELRVIPKAGHWPQFETPVVTQRHIRGFLSTPLKLLKVEF
ncbi:MAG: alpha/beta fold hydrolase [Chloroflexales bacterium]|nr:alpha/beta fold hydrolase [Chloroflexales bacterium]